MYGDFAVGLEIGLDGQKYVVTAWDDSMNYTSDEILMLNKIYNSKFEQSKRMHERAHKLLWKLIEHNIQRWQLN